MGKLKNGITGPFSGKVGNLVGSSWLGINYIKTAPGKRTAKVSQKEKNNRNKFAITHAWLQPLLDFVREGFKDYSPTSRGFNAAKSYVLKNAVEGVQPDIYINPALVKVSVGTLPLSTNITAEKAGDDKIRFTWDTNTPDTDPFDQVMVLAYNAEHKGVHDHITGQLRQTGSYTIDVVKGFKYHLYLAFNAADRSRRSDSVYLGEMEM